MTFVVELIIGAGIAIASWRWFFRGKPKPRCKRCGHFAYEHFDFEDRRIDSSGDLGNPYRHAGCVHLMLDEDRRQLWCDCPELLEGEPAELPEARIVGGAG